MSDSVLPHGQKPTRLPRPWDSPGKNTGVVCHFLLQYMKVKSVREVVAQSSPTLSDPMDYSLPGSSVHGVFQARVLEWVSIAFSKPGLIPWPQSLPLAMVHTLKSGFPMDPNKSTSYPFVSQWIFAMRHQGLSFISFGRVWVLGESWRIRLSQI